MSPATVHHRPVRSRVLLVAALISVLGAACAPAPPGGGGGTIVPFAPVTLPLPPLGVTPPPTNIPLLVCNIAYYPPGFSLVGATVTIPGLLIDTTQATVGVPNVVVNIPRTIVALPALGLSCGPISLTTQVNVVIPATVRVQAATINLNTGVLALRNPSFTINGVGLQLPGLLGGLGLTIPLPPITVPLPSISVPLT